MAISVENTSELVIIGNRVVHREVGRQDGVGAAVVLHGITELQPVIFIV